MSYRKHGGLHFIRIGRFGFSFYIAKRKPTREQGIAELVNRQYGRQA